MPDGTGAQGLRLTWSEPHCGVWNAGWVRQGCRVPTFGFIPVPRILSTCAHIFKQQHRGWWLTVSGPQRGDDASQPTAGRAAAGFQCVNEQEGAHRVRRALPGGAAQSHHF